MQQDRFGKALGTVVRRILDDAATINYAQLYTARVVQWQSSGVNPSGLVDVIFDLPDLKSKTGIPVLPPWPGVSYQPKPGSLVVVGWLQGDERMPYATAWLGVGGVTMAELAGDRVDVTAATVNLGDATGQVLCKSAVAVALQAFAFACTSSTDPAVVVAAQALNMALTGSPGAPAGTTLLPTTITSKTKAA